MADFTSHAPGTFSWPELATTDQKGAVAELAIAAAAIDLGIGVSRPLSDERYDLIFDLGGR